MSGIFISYRREDGSRYTGRVADKLNKFRAKDILRDIGAVSPSVDFVEIIERSMSSNAVLLI